MEKLLEKTGIRTLKREKLIADSAMKFKGNISFLLQFNYALKKLLSDSNLFTIFEKKKNVEIGQVDSSMVLETIEDFFKSHQSSNIKQRGKLRINYLILSTL